MLHTLGLQLFLGRGDSAQMTNILVPSQMFPMSGMLGNPRILAEDVGFEPTGHTFVVQRFSKPSHLASLPILPGASYGI